MKNHDLEIAVIDWNLKRIERELINLVEKNNILEADLKPLCMRLNNGREKEEELRDSIYRLCNRKLALGSDQHEKGTA
ncbi:hypothetical protein ACQCN2_00875 [Brevibacillus ginsengisoli]|uniref:hypothetical protein n=1 Tax=Brevibacillus ginsengisoli TaxID=363854 RepID=UPI003CE86D47